MYRSFRRIQMINTHLSENEGNYAGKHMLMGDFNFPKKEVEWKQSHNSIIPDFQQGQDVLRKIVFEKDVVIQRDRPSG